MALCSDSSTKSHTHCEAQGHSPVLSLANIPGPLFFPPFSLANLPSYKSSPVHDICVVGTVGHILNLPLGHLSRGKIIPLWTLLAQLFQLQTPLQQYTISQKKK